MTSMHGRYQKDISTTFRRYALVPAVLLVLLSYAAFLFFFTRAIVDRTREVNQSFVTSFGSVVESYAGAADRFANDMAVLEALRSGKASTDLYDELYAFVNAQDIWCDFYLYDLAGQSVLSSTHRPPAYVSRLGFRQRVLSGQEAVISIEESDGAVLAISRTVYDGGAPAGLFFFDIKESDFQLLTLEREYVDLVLINSHRQVCWSTSPVYVNRFGKLDEAFEIRDGLASVNGARYVLHHQPIERGRLSVTTIAGFSGYERLFLIVGLFLILVFSLVIVGIVFSARLIARRKTRAIEELAHAISFVQLGDFQHPVDLKTGDEFEEVAQSYNLMLKDIQRLMRENEEKAYLTSVSELKQLEAQFNPHFLFNTLEVIRYNLYLAPQTVEQALIDLSSILRYSLSSAQEVTLREDLTYIESYFRIQSIRFDDSFVSDLRVQPEAMECYLPKLILQPIVENAFKYGFHGQDQFLITLEAGVAEGRLQIRIRNNGAPIEARMLSEIRACLQSGRNSSGHFGLFSVHRRIALLYGEGYGLDVQSSAEQTEVLITLPEKREAGNHVQNAHRGG